MIAYLFQFMFNLFKRHFDCLTVNIKFLKVHGSEYPPPNPYACAIEIIMLASIETCSEAPELRKKQLKSPHAWRTYFR